MPLRINVDSMSDMELQDHINALQKERERRHSIRQEKMWQNIYTAIYDYCKEYGPIEIVDYQADETTMHVDGNWDFSTFGKIEA